jgi:glyoxylase-like metal-dependent hydrolase (beta-lactamase superfamily II)
MTAQLHVLHAGYADDRVASTVSVAVEGDAITVIDPGMVASRSLILDPLRALGIAPEDVTDVVLSHHHPDHTVNIALFEHARVHDHTATYIADEWIDHEEGADFVVSPSVVVRATPGHTDQDVSTFITTDDGLIVLSHLWWHADGPADDPFAHDRELLREQRDLVLAARPHLILPGHGPAFTPSASTPR